MDSLRTLAYVGAAGLLCWAAAVYGPRTTARKPPLFSQQGEPFFPQLEDLSQATSLEVWAFDAESAEAKPFKVALEDGVWRIPSKHGYPADAAERLGKVAAALANLEREVLYSSQEADRVATGTVDPQASLEAPLDGRGRRVILRDAQDKVLADVVVGESLAERPDKRFVREPEDKRIYAAGLDVDLSTEFKDWIETDVLDLAVADITSVTVDRYSIDEDRGALLQEDRIELGHVDGEWQVDGMSADQQVATAAVTSLTDTLKALEIVDVEPFDGRRAASYGFFATRDGGVLSNEGELRVTTREGVGYLIRFGEVVPGADDEEGLRRYTIVDCVARPQALSDPEDEAAQAELERRVHELNQRFRGWYFVISAGSFDALRPTRDALLEPRTEEPEDDGHGHGGDGFFPPVPDDHGPPEVGPPLPADDGAPGEAMPPEELAPPEEAAPPEATGPSDASAAPTDAAPTDPAPADPAPADARPGPDIDDTPAVADAGQAAPSEPSDAAPPPPLNRLVLPTGDKPAAVTVGDPALQERCPLGSGTVAFEEERLVGRATLRNAGAAPLEVAYRWRFLDAEGVELKRPDAAEGSAPTWGTATLAPEAETELKGRAPAPGAVTAELLVRQP